LTRRTVAALTAQIAGRGASADLLVVDCHNLLGVDPWALCALLDLARASDKARCVLAALTPELLITALEVGLAQSFTICRDVDAAHALLQSEDGETCGA
jgi:hypothetical protein